MFCSLDKERRLCPLFNIQHYVMTSTTNHTDLVLTSLSTFLGRSKAVLGLAELGQVEGGDLLRLLDLLLVRLHLALHLVDQGLHPEDKNIREGLFWK